MNISIVAVGKLKEKYLKQGIQEYMKRLTPYAKVEIVEVADERAPEGMSASEASQVKEKEGKRILARLSADTYIIALAIEGSQWSSEQMAKQLEQLAVHGKSKIAFIIGGSVGLSDELLNRADEKLSFSKMTFPHQLMRLILTEQIYRSFRIIKNHSYHK